MTVGEQVPTEIASALEPGDVCFKQETFRFFLKQELARAKRYGFYVALLLFQVKENGHAEEGQGCRKTSKFLNRNLRKTDYLGTVKENTLGVLLLNAQPENTAKARDRLVEETKLFLHGATPKADLAVSSVVYPTDASSIDELIEGALSRLTS